jgi:hypothetical protein
LACDFTSPTSLVHDSETVCRRVPQKWKPSILAWGRYGMPSLLSGADHRPMGRDLDLRGLRRAPEATSNRWMDCCTVEKSATEVRTTVTSSAYATKEAGSDPRPIRTPGRRCLGMVRKG